MSCLSTEMVHNEVSLEPAALRQFIDPNFEGPKVYMDPKEFEKKISEYIRSGVPLQSGYSPFCKHIFVPNFCFLKPSYLKVTPENEALLKTVYDAHHPNDLPVLTRFFPAESVRDITPDAQFLDVILYDRSEINQQNIAQGKAHLNTSEAPWGIMRIKAQDVDRELPMLPSTMIKNCLGKEFGGSGVPMDAQKYRESVAFWSEHAAIR